MISVPMSADAARRLVERNNWGPVYAPQTPKAVAPKSFRQQHAAVCAAASQRTAEGKAKLKGQFTIHDVQAAMGFDSYGKAKGYVRTRTESGVMRATGRGNGYIGDPRYYEWTDENSKESL